MVTAFQYMTDRWPTDGEFKWFDSVTNLPHSPASVLFGVSPEFNLARPTVIFYSACHSIQILHWLYNWSKTGFIRDVNWLVLFAVQLDRDFEAGKPLPPYFPMMEMALSKADQVVYTPMFRSAPLDPRVIKSRVAPDKQWISFHAPSFAALWPVCLHWGDEHVRRALEMGFPPYVIKQGIRDATFPCRMVQRWEEDFDRMLAKDEEVEVRICDFFKKFWRNKRMFLTFNHPSYHLVSHLSQKIEKKLLGYAAVTTSTEDQFSLDAVPENDCGFFPVWPDHDIASNELGVAYATFHPDHEHHYESIVDKVQELNQKPHG